MQHNVQVTTIKFDPTEVVAQADQLAPRTSGLHVSQIYADLENTVARKMRKAMPEDELDAYRAQGFLFEHVLGQALATSIADGQYVVRPGEVKVDGIIGSPDLIDLRDCCIWECKCTYRSFNKMGEAAGGLSNEFWVWGIQMKAYAKMFSVRHAKLRVVFINGDYKKFSPMFKGWDLEWSEREIKETWTMLKQHARNRGWL